MPEARVEDGYQFDAKFDWWTKDHLENYQTIKTYFDAAMPGKALRCMEVGVFEGRSMIWFVRNFLCERPDSYYEAVEPDPAPFFTDNFRKLVKDYPDVTIHHHQEYSEFRLPDILGDTERCRGPEFDLMYYDGDHNAQGLLRDMVMGWELLKVGGVMLVDDYEMEATDPWHYISHKEFLEHPRANFQHPRAAVDAFLSIYRGLYGRLVDNFQVGLVKRVHLGAKNLDHGDETQGQDGEGKFEYHAKKE